MVSTASDELPVSQQRWRAIFAVTVGNALEWYDFVIFGYFVLPIANNFFPVGSDVGALLLALATFGVAFFFRPLGAVIIGNYADRYGRKPALTLTILMMMVGTATIAFAPPYSVAGIAAPALIVCGRILQGFSAGGEFGSATAYLAEQNSARRGFFASWQFAGQALAAVLATSSGVILTNILTAEQLRAWGWRLPLIVGLLIGPVAYYIRRRVHETQEFRSTSVSPAPLRETFAEAKGRLAVAVGAVVVTTVATYTLLFMPTFAARHLNVPLADGFKVALLTGAIQAILVPIAGALSDRWGRLPIAYGANIAMLLVSYPLFSWLTATPTLASLLGFQVFIGCLVALYAGVLPALMSELFPTRLRTTGLSIGYSTAVAVFGGLAPFINASLIELTGSRLAPSYYLMFAAAVTLAALAAASRLGVK